jgi:U3 small nucleolar ribonucleoprotein protein IMP4
MKRNIRLRREYLYKKSLEAKNAVEADKKERLQRAIHNNTAIPDDLTKEEAKLRESSHWDDSVTAKPKTHIDDEYGSWTGEPRVCVTTSREPSSKLKEFSKELRLIFPTSRRMNRGQTTLPELVEACRKADFTDIVVCTEHRGDPDGLLICHLPHGPTMKISISDCVTRHDIGKEAAENASEAIPHLIFHDVESKLGKRVRDILAHLFPVAKPDSKRLITFFNRDDVISFRHHVAKKQRANEKPELIEIGPRFELRPYEIRLGTLEQKDGAEVEWALRSYTNSAKKRRLFGAEPTES